MEFDGYKEFLKNKHEMQRMQENTDTLGLSIRFMQLFIYPVVGSSIARADHHVTRNAVNEIWRFQDSDLEQTADEAFDMSTFYFGLVVDILQVEDRVYYQVSTFSVLV